MWKNFEVSDPCTNVVLLPALAPDPSCPNFEVYESQISDVWIIPGVPTLAQPEDIWSLVDNSNVGGGKHVKGIGGLTEEPRSINIRGANIKQATRYTLNFTVFRDRELIRYLQCTDTQHFRLFFSTRGKRFFGGQKGLSTNFVNPRWLLSPESEAIETGLIEFRFNGWCQLPNQVAPNIDTPSNTNGAWITDPEEDWDTEFGEWWELGI